jgi:hypothetical protein
MGYKIAYVTDAEVVHVHDETSIQVYNRYRREAIALKRIFPNEHFRLGDFMRLFLINMLSDYTHALREGVFGQQWFGIPLFRLMQFWGTYRGFAQHGPVTSRLKQTFYYPRRGQKWPEGTLAGERDRMLVDYRTKERLHRENN